MSDEQHTNDTGEQDLHDPLMREKDEPSKALRRFRFSSSFSLPHCAFGVGCI